MRLKSENIIKIFSLLTGAVFLVSGIGKSLAASDFGNLITTYGFWDFNFIAPIIILLEVIMGTLLIFRIHLKQISIVAILFLLTVTAVYIYGYFAHNVTDCGCFGAISSLNKTHPVFVVVRNVLLMYMLFEIWRKAEICNSAWSLWKVAVIIIIICFTSYFSGYTHFPKFINLYDEQEKFTGKNVLETPLNEFISVSKDSTYLVFVFSYTCPHCLNSIENLKQYEKTETVDKVIGLALNDSVHNAVFKQNFNPKFEIKNYDLEDITLLAQGLPYVYYIKNNVVQLELMGELPCLYNFNQLYSHLFEE